MSTGGDLAWSGGTISGTGTTSVAGSGSSISGSAVKVLSRTLSNTGTIIYSSADTSSPIFLGSTGTTPGVLNNGGTFNVTSGGDFSLTGSVTSQAINNSGVWNMSGAAGTTSAVNNIAFNNSGSVNVDSGTFDLRGGYSQTAGMTRLSGGNLTTNLNLNLLGGELTGAGTITGDISNTGATVRPGNAGPGVITVVGKYFQNDAGTIAIEIGGTAPGTQYDQLSIGGAASLGGTLTTTLINGFTPSAGSQFQIVNAGTRNGTFAAESTPPGVMTNYTATGVSLAGAAPSASVTTTLDVIDPNDGVLSLREAILFANSNPGIDTITFNIPGAGLQTIAPTSPLPTITDGVVIDGYSQAGASRNMNGPGLGNNAVLKILLTGASAPTDTTGLLITAANSSVTGLVIAGFNNGSPAGIALTGAGATGALIEGNFIGTDSSGTGSSANYTGIRISAGASGNIIRGNVISGNSHDGIDIFGDAVNATNNNVVAGNLIGTNAAGTAAMPNQVDGIEVFNNANSNTIGGPAAADRNILSGNGSDGMDMFGNGTGALTVNNDLIQGNYFGLNVMGNAAIPGVKSNGDGIDLFQNARANRLIGNVFSGSRSDGVDLFNATDTVIQGNFFGTNATGTAAVPNGGDGLALFGILVNTTVGGANAGEGNVFSGNGGIGLSVSGLNVNGMAILGNIIGADATGRSALGNGRDGVRIRDAAGISVGGIAAGQGNLIAFNAGNGVTLSGDISVPIRGNSIYANTGLGIDLGSSGVTSNDVGDGDVGTNGLQNFPVLSLDGTGGTSISASVNSTPNASFTIDFYASFAADPSGFGEGQFYVGSTDVTTDASGNVTAIFSTGTPLPPSTLTATATDAAGNTSEFSAALLIPGAATTYIWDGGGGADTNWFNAFNWAPDGVPGVLDSAVLDSKATITLASPAFIGGFTQSDGILTGNGMLRVSGFTWSGGTEDGPGLTVIGAGGFLSIEGAALKILSQRTLENSGAGVWSGSGDVQLSQGAIFNNGGSLEIRNDANFVGISDTVQPRFINKGTLEKTGGSGVTIFSNVDVENSGTFRISAGTVWLSGTSTFTQSGGRTALSGGSLDASGLLMFEGGRLGGAGTIAASVINSGARVEPGGNNKTAGTLSITGDYTQGAAATLSIELGGTIAGNQYDQLLIGGTANLGGTLEINTLGGFKIPDGSSFNVLTYPSFNGSFAVLDAPSGITTAPGAGGLLLNAQTPAPGPRAMTVTDVDGDVVTLKVNKGSIPSDAITLGPNGELQRIDLRAVGSKLGGASFTISVEQAGGGDGAVNVGAIEASGMNLGKVRIEGDLGQIDIGTGEAHKAALKSLSLQSLGTMGASTQMAGTVDPLLSQVSGALNKLSVERDIKNAVVEVSDKLGKVRIGGNLIDNAASTPAQLQVARGGIGVFLNGGIPPVGASHAGTLFAADIGSVTVMGNIDGGEISAETGIKNVKVVGSLRSDDPLDPAILRVGAHIDKVLIKGDVQNALILAGYNRALEPRNADASIGQITVKGSWSASSVVAGVADPGDDGFGRNDALIAGDATPDVLSRIASVIIKGMATGSTVPSDHSAITAQKIGELRINGDKVPLTKAPDDLNLDPLNQNFRAVEV